MATPYETVKAAWDSSDRADALHRAAEALAAIGISRDELSDALMQLLLEVRGAGADDETEEIINGVADRVYGWCHASRHISFSTSGGLQAKNGTHGRARATEASPME